MWKRVFNVVMATIVAIAISQIADFTTFETVVALVLFEMLYEVQDIMNAVSKTR